MLKVERYISEAISENCYLLINQNSKKCVVVDPGQDIEKFADYIKKYEIRYILLTHGHFDHIAGVNSLKEYTDAPVLIHKDDNDMISDPATNLSHLMGSDTIIKADTFVSDGEIIDFGDNGIKVIHTPGHTPGSVCYKCGDFLFSGDTVFKDSIGRTDLPCGDYYRLRESVERLMELSDNISVYPGHGEMTTIGEFRRFWTYFD